VAFRQVSALADQEKAGLSRRLERIEEMLAQVLGRQDKSG
jgi:hypothetical protein